MFAYSEMCNLNMYYSETLPTHEDIRIVTMCNNVTGS